MLRTPGQNIAGFVPFANEILLSQHFQKKVITVNYDFPGYTVACATALATLTNPLHKNQLFYRETTSPGKYAPLLLLMVHAWSSTSLDIDNNDTGKLGSGSTHKIHIWDNSASIWGTGTNDRNRYVSSYGAADSGGAGYVRATTDGAPDITPQADADAVVAAMDAGAVDFKNYVVVDQALDFRTTAKPFAISADFAIDALYAARLNQRFLSGYSVLPSNFLEALKVANQRLFFDNPQI
jgi:hypothetical protein